MRKWTKSACAVLAWGILPILVLVGGQSPVRPAQAIHRIAISTTQVTLTAFNPATTPSPSFVVVSGMPGWLRAMLFVTGIVIGLALLAEPVIAMCRRRTRDRRRQRAVEKASIVMADHDRLIVTYSPHDDTVYVLTPPGEDPRAVLRAARLVVPEEKYEELAWKLGVSGSWPLE